ncbi:MAG: hypothetical protein WKF96_23825, partial [Solirubrobacteraceae bacterium]
GLEPELLDLVGGDQLTEASVLGAEIPESTRSATRVRLASAFGDVSVLDGDDGCNGPPHAVSCRLVVCGYAGREEDGR